MKKITKIFGSILAAMLLIPILVSAAQPVQINGGGTGWGFPGGLQLGNVLIGNGLSPIATSSDLTFSTLLKKLTATYASSTAMSATTFCFTGDTCRTTWPSGASGFAPFSVLTSDGSGNAIATGTQLTIGNLLATTTATNRFIGNMVIAPTGTPAQPFLTVGPGTGDNTHTIDIFQPASGVQNVVSLNSTANAQNNFLQFQPAGANSITNVNWIVGRNANSDSFSWSLWNGATVLQKLALLDTGEFGIATVTPSRIAQMTIATTSTSQLSLSAGAGLAQWLFRNAGGNFYLSTSTVAGNATTSVSALEIDGSTGTTTLRGLNISAVATSTSNVGFKITGGCYAVGNTCLGSSAGTVTSVGVSSSGSITVGSSPVTTSGTITADLNMANSNTWTAKQTFTNSSTTLASFQNASTTTFTIASSTYSDLSSWTRPMRIGATANILYGGMAVTGAQTNNTPVSGTLYAIPTLVTKEMTVDEMAFDLESTGATSHARIGIYRDDGNMYPAGLVVDAGETNTASHGLGTILLTGLSAKLTPGLYWLVWENDGTSPIIRGYATGGLMPMLGQGNSIGTVAAVGWTVVNAYGALPGTFPASASFLQNPPFPGIFFRGI